MTETETGKNVAHDVLEVLRRLVNKLQSEHFFEGVPGPNTLMLGIVVSTTDEGLKEEQLDKVASDLVLEIREHSRQTFVKLGMPREIYCGSFARDPVSRISVRAIRFFDPEIRRLFYRFEVGMN